MTLSALSLQLINPINNNSAFATEGTKASRVSTATPTASLAIGGMDLAQTITTSPGSTAYREHTVEVSSENIVNYMLTIIGPVSLNGGSTMTGADGKTPAKMANNSWGYAYGQSGGKETMTYSSFTSNVQTLESAEGAPNFTKNLVFAAKFAQDATPAHYRGNVEVALTATPGEVIAGLGFGGITEMQSMDSTVCDRVSVGTEGRLIDVRDDKVYWVAKLADNKCWMTQNLAIGTEGITLDSETSDLPSGKTMNFNPVQFGDGGFSFGKYVYTTPTIQDVCKLEATSVDTIKDLTLDSCAEHGWQDVSGLKASGDPAFYKNNNNKVVSNGEYDAHYLLGAYYGSYSMAITERPSSGSRSTVLGSICPKGWTLPHYERGESNINNDYYTLLDHYGLTQSITSDQYDIRLAPLYFLYSGSGWANSAKDALSVGNSGNYATDLFSYNSFTASSNNVPILFSGTILLSPDTALNTSQRIQLRCVAK